MLVKQLNVDKKIRDILVQLPVSSHIDRMEVWLNDCNKRAILNKVFIMVGITPLQRYKMAIHGLHTMPVMWEEIIPRIVAEAKLLPDGSTV